MLGKSIARCRAFLGESRGNIGTLFALTLPIGLSLAAVAVDAGALYLERREAQSVADLAAIYGAANISNAEAAVLTVLRDNGHKDAVLQSDKFIERGHAVDEVVLVEKGRYKADPDVEPAARFVVGAAPPNAIRVTFKKQGTAYFGASLVDDIPMTTTAVATARPEAAFSVGSRLASLNEGILNDLLTSLIGTNVSLSLMDYNALVGARVDALSFLDALAADLDITAGTYDDVLASEVTVGQIATALAGVTHDHAVDLALTKLFGATGSGTLKVPLSRLIDLGSVGKVALGQHASGFDADVGLMDLLSAAAAVANGSKQIAVNLDHNLGGLTAIKLELAIGEPPQGGTFFAIGETGKIVRTAQTRLKLEAKVSTAGLLGGQLGATIRVPLYVELAYAEAQIKKISCPTGQPASAVVTLDVRPGIADLYIGEVNSDDFKNFTTRPFVSPATLVHANTLGLVSIDVTGKSHVEIGNLGATSRTFNKTEIDNGVVKTVSTRDITQSLAASLFGELSLGVKVKALGLMPFGLVLPTDFAVVTAVATILSGVTKPVDTILFNALSALGVRVGEADVRVTGVSCGRSVLVL
jgi:uncharacterized membrane protein